MMKTRLVESTSMSVLMLLLSSCSDERTSIVVSKSDIVEAVYSSVNIEPTKTYVVNSAVSGYIESFFVEIGDTILLNQELFRIRDVQSSANSSNAQLAYEMARRNLTGELSLLEDIRLNIENAALRRQNDSISYNRNKLLFQKNVSQKILKKNS